MCVVFHVIDSSFKPFAKPMAFGMPSTKSKYNNIINFGNNTLLDIKHS